uniref:CSON006521 protein n=1 Tax=Culicoides sonorensis TaxID=179676 RepID=A0A336LW82_CULSO
MEEGSSISMINLPDVILLDVFTLLNHPSRLNCRLVCHHWLYLLDTSKRFQLDRHLYLSDCLLGVHEPPISVLMESNLTFSSLKFGKCHLSSKLEELSDFFDKMCETVIDLDLTDFKCEIYGNIFVIFEKFKNLKILRLSLSYQNKMWEKMLEYLESQKYKESCLNPIDELILSDLSGDANIFERFLNVMPPVKKLSIKSLSGFKDMSKLLKSHGDLIKNVGPNVITIYHSANRVAEDAVLKELKSLSSQLQLESLECGWRVDDYNSTSINDFLSTQKILKSVSLECYGDIPVDLYQNLTKLTVRFDDTITSFHKLMPLKKLKYLDFCISENYRDAEYRDIHPCFFGHEKIPISTLETLFVKTGPRKYIYFTRDRPGKSCTQCWRTMLESFPNINSLKFCHHKFVPEIIELIMKNGQNFKQLILINLRYNECFLTKWNDMPRLEHLELWQATKISVEGIVNLSRKCPSLRRLRLLGGLHGPGKHDQVMKTICLNFCNLEVLEIDFDGIGLSKNAFGFLCLLRDLKVLGLGDHEKAELSEAQQMILFKNLPKLKVIHDIGSDSNTVSRIEFLELIKNESKYTKLMEKEFLGESKWKKIIKMLKGH